MKKFIYLLFAIPFIVNAQSFSCDNISQYGKLPFHTANNLIDFNEEPIIVFNVFFHDEDPNIPVEIIEAEFLAAIAYLNQTYNQFNIFFKYRGFDNSADIVENMINIFTREFFGGTATETLIRVTYLAFENGGGDYQFIIAHEVGHFLGLLHTTDETYHTSGTFTIPLSCNGNTITSGNFADTSSISENVTRDQTDTENYNAHIAGDFVMDTPATYPFVNLCIDSSTTLTYLSSEEVVDFVGEKYIDIDVNNIMDTDTREEYYEFKTNFTSGQGTRMRETIDNVSLLQTMLTTIPSLYEPYQGEYYFAGPNLPIHRPLFQPGFDYKFVSAGGETPSGAYQIFNTPSDYTNISFAYDSNVILNQVDASSLDLDNINHPNRSAIIIEQIEEQPRKCYHNVNRGASNGKVIKFNDNIINTNYTITEKDSMSINQPSLIQDLENGLYIIEKNYNDGEQEQNTILKINNND